MKTTIIYILIIIVSALPVFGQEQPLNDTIKLPSDTLEEIVVSASKMNLKMKELPASVSIIKASSVEVNNIHTLNQVNALVPNFVMPDYGSKLDLTSLYKRCWLKD